MAWGIDMNRIERYHLKVKHEDSFKLIQHIRFLHNSKYLKQISHEGITQDETFVCIILKDRLSINRHKIIKRNLDSLELVMI